MTEPVALTHEESDPLVQVKLEQGVMTIRLGSVHNDFLWSLEMMDAFCDLIQSARENSQVRVLVIDSVGVDFCKGLLTTDFSQGSIKPDAKVRAILDRFEQCCHRDLALMPQPVVAKVRGVCHFAGIQLLEGCDVVFAEEYAQFVIQEEEVHQLTRTFEPASHRFHGVAEAGVKRCVERSPKTFDTQEAERIGLVTLSFMSEVLTQEVLSLATSFCEKDALALQFTKETIAHVPSMSWDASVNFTAAKFAELKSKQSVETSTRAAAVASFLAGKTKPGKGV